MYQKVSTDLKFVDREKDIEKFWRDNDIFRKSMDSRKEGPTYTFYDGPPTANGKPHIGHVLTRVIKDMIPRYRTMKGYMVPRKAGWDTHGLPVELEVEKLLGLDGKEQIEEYGLDPFIDKCKESVWKYKGMWEDFSGTVGFWADMDDPYVTYHDDYIESAETDYNDDFDFEPAKQSAPAEKPQTATLSGYVCHFSELLRIVFNARIASFSGVGNNEFSLFRWFI